MGPIINEEEPDTNECDSSQWMRGNSTLLLLFNRLFLENCRGVLDWDFGKGSGATVSARLGVPNDFQGLTELPTETKML